MDFEIKINMYISNEIKKKKFYLWMNFRRIFLSQKLEYQDLDHFFKCIRNLKLSEEKFMLVNVYVSIHSNEIQKSIKCEFIVLSAE